ncbi:MAG: glycosyltransferase family 39 protein [Alphaproteobacteria bacterium]|nr:glycosyltransferase family 39 protein [Alphaproteobacteria bacterium]MCB9791202.1 glycosyltransferase family 39 protein [Alphaproteobacteria bacterium]
MRRHLPELLCALLAAGVVLWGLDLPLVEDGLFWWVPKALRVAEIGPAWVLDTLPAAARPEAALPPQWAGGLPDYAHPPLWYWYLGAWTWALGPTHTAVHLAALPLAALFGLGLVRLLRQAGGPLAAWAALALPLLPPVAANLLRADTDLPLMALTPWALYALLTRREGLFALCAGLATACKEPGILLAAPGLLACLLDRRLGWGWAWPPMVLAAWAGLHHAETGWALAGSERLPESLVGWLHDLGAVLRITLLEQGRWLLLPLAAWAARAAVPTRVERRTLLILGAHTLTQLAFFGTLNFLGGLDRVDAHTHVRYLIPGLLGACALALALAPYAAAPLTLASLIFLHRPSVDGPEASLHGLNVGRALRQAAPMLEARLALGEEIWVGSYAWTAYTRPYAGVVEAPLDGLRIYAYGTDPAEVSGLVLQACVGEPLGRLQELDLQPLEELRVHQAWVRLYRVGPR